MDGLDQPVDEKMCSWRRPERPSLVQALTYRGENLRALSLYEYMSEAEEQRCGGADRVGQHLAVVTDVAQLLRRPGENAAICLDGYLSMNFNEDDDI
jgi:hypothetical protein